MLLPRLLATVEDGRARRTLARLVPRMVGGRGAGQVLARALQSIAHQFDMFTVAEMVETAEDAAYLIDMGIDCLQGYYFGAPTIVPPWRSPGTAAKRF